MHLNDVSMENLLTIPFQTAQGAQMTLGDLQGKAILVVNVASKCGLTPQYEGLEALYKKYHERGLSIIGFPANNFMGQEPGTDEEIQEFCKLTYDVDFPVMHKISVKGEDQHPLYAALTEMAPERITPEKSSLLQQLRDGLLGPKSPHDVLWNFEKFLLSSDGKILQRFSPDVTPEDSQLIAAIEASLA